MYNIISKTNDALWNKTFTNGLSSYTQANCKCTLTNDGYRIYRPPNKTPANDGNTMWGGLVIYPFNINSNALQKTHTYIIKFEVKGQTTNKPSMSWNNLVGWNGGGLTPNPTTIAQDSISANFQSNDWKICQWIFKINDDIYKVCTSSYSSFVKDQTYLSYKGFKFGYDYTNTGELGTDIYLRNFRLYDITESPNETKLLQTGIFQAGNLVEYSDNMSIKIDGDLYTNNFIEW